MHHYLSVGKHKLGSFSEHYISLSAPSGSPVGFTAVAGEREVVFSWSPPPVTERNGVITSYTLSCSPSPPQSPSSGPLTVAGFSPHTSYSCSLVASNTQGSGPPAPTSFTTLQDCERFFMTLSFIFLQPFRYNLPNSFEWTS